MRVFESSVEVDETRDRAYDNEDSAAEGSKDDDLPRESHLQGAEETDWKPYQDDIYQNVWSGDSVLKVKCIDTFWVVQIPTVGKRAPESVSEDCSQAPCDSNRENAPNDISMRLFGTEPCCENDSR